MAKRSWTERIEEVEARREKTQKKAAQYEEELKRLRKLEAEEIRKQRTHKLVVCGAELAALFGKPLEQDEVLAVVNFLRKQREMGNFILETEKKENGETVKIDQGKAEQNPNDPYFGFFNL